MARGYNAFAPLNPMAIRRQARGYVNAQIQPLLRQLNADFTRRSSAGQSSIASGTNALAAQLAPAAAQTQANYGAAEATQRADNAALANRLGSLGSQSSNSLAQQLGAINAPASQVSQVAGGAAATGTGAGNAGFAMGSSSLAALLAQGAAAQQYAGQLPNIARLGGAQRSQQLGQQLESERATQAGQIRSRIPGLVGQIGQQLNAQEFQKAVAVQSGLVDQQKMQTQAGQFNARQQQSAGQFNARQQQSQQHFDTQTQLAMDRIKISGAQLGIAQQREERMGRARSGKKGGFTPAQVSKFQGTAIDTVKDWKHGIPAVFDAQGNVQTPEVKPRPRDAVGSFKYLVNHGIPPSVADWAVGQVYGKWKAARGRGPGGAGPR